MSAASTCGAVQGTDIHRIFRLGGNCLENTLTENNRPLQKCATLMIFMLIIIIFETHKYQ